MAGLCLWCATLSVQAEGDANQQRLQEVQQELKKRQANLKAGQKQQQQAQQQLKQAELSLARQAQKLHHTRSEILSNKTQQNKLKQQQSELQQQQKAQQEVLAAQLQSHYMAGSSDYLKMLLSQQDPSQVERTLSYFEYLNRARIDAIKALQATLARLRQVAEQLLLGQHQLEELLTQQSEQRTQLEQEQATHQRLIQRLGRRLQSEQESIEQLQDSEQQLKTLMDRSVPSRSTIRLSGLSKGKLNWPSQGKVRHRFNSIRQGQIRWKGVLLSSPSGADVNAVANGKVLFADWVKGMGLVMVVDHGAEFLTIYGHAQTLLRQPGDEVRAGDTIALVGQSGGLSQPSLYFEMRHKGKPLNPSHWCR